MFGYVTPCKMELKIKDYEKFKSYYCGLCKAIKSNYGNVPRLVLNYDMTFLGLLLDSLSNDKCTYKRNICLVHPIKKRVYIVNNDAINYASFFNVVLTYYKLLDNIVDDRSPIGKLGSLFLKQYIDKVKDTNLKFHQNYVDEALKKLNKLENTTTLTSLDEVCDPFADLTGYILSSYVNKLDIPLQEQVKDNLYWLGYNLGKWIYIIDAWDDLEKDMKESKYNLLNKLYNDNMAPFEDFSKVIKDKVDFILVSCASHCADYLEKLPLLKNKELLSNILQYGLMEKMDIVFKRSEVNNAKSI